MERVRKSPLSKPATAEDRAGRFSGKGKRNYGRLARSDEYSPSVTVSGRESRHFVQVCWRTEDSRVQARQSLAFQKIEAGPVDGREVERDGTAAEAQAQDGSEGSGATLEKLSWAQARDTHKRWAHVWIRIEVHCWSGCGLLEHQGGGAEEEGRPDRSRASWPGAALVGHRGRFDDRGLGNGIERDFEAGCR